MCEKGFMKNKGIFMAGIYLGRGKFSTRELLNDRGLFS